MANGLSINTAPRNFLELLNLTGAQRCGLFDQLCRELKTQLEPGKASFKKLSAEEQVTRLLLYFEALNDAITGHVVMHATLPVRTKSHRVNDARMNKFADEVENVLRTMHRQNAQSIATTRFDSHGLLFIGFIPPKRPAVQFIEVKGQGPDGTKGGGVPGNSAAADNRLSQIMMMLQYKAMTGGDITEKDVEEVVQQRLRDVSHETVTKILERLQALITDHDEVHKGDQDNDCRTSRDLRLLQKVIETRVKFQLS